MMKTILAVSAIGLAACGGGNGDNVPGSGDTTMKTVGTTGGTVALEGATLTIPQGALGATVDISITSTTTADPDYTNRSPIYQFTPSGQTFSQPVTVAIAYTDDSQPVSLFWSNSAGGYDEVPATLVNGVATGQIAHFSSGFVGRRHNHPADAAPPDSMVAPQPDSAPPTCLPLGGKCAQQTDCCSGLCGANGCLQSNFCVAPGHSCANVNLPCCNGVCMTGSLVCN